MVEASKMLCMDAHVHVFVTYMCVLVKEVQSIQIYSQDTGCLDGGRVAALDIEEGGPKHWKSTD